MCVRVLSRWQAGEVRQRYWGSWKQTAELRHVTYDPYLTYSISYNLTAQKHFLSDGSMNCEFQTHVTGRKWHPVRNIGVTAWRKDVRRKRLSLYY